MKTISKKQRSMLPRTALVLIVIATAYYVYPEKLGIKHQQSFSHFSSRQLLSEDDSQEYDTSPEDPNKPTTTDKLNGNVTAEKECKGMSENLTCSTGMDNFPTDAFNCDQLTHGAVILHVLGIVYMFYALALVCDDFFVPSLDVISEKLGISNDVAGATFMAAGGSAPELFTSIIGVFIAESDVGIGTIVGSAVFNILFVIAACAFAAKDALSLTAWPLIRDVFFYSISLILLVAFFLDEKIHWWEALILFLWYFAYVGFMKFNEDVEDKLRSLLGLDPIERSKDKQMNMRQLRARKGLYHLMSETINPVPKKTEGGEAEEVVTFMKDEEGVDSVTIKNETGPQGLSGLKSTLTQDGQIVDNGKELNEIDAPKANNPETLNSNQVTDKDPDNAGDNGEAGDNKDEENDKKDEDDEDEGPIDMSFPKDGGFKKILLYLISFPIMAPLCLTLPDTKDPKKRKFFIITFFGSILWIAAYSYLMVWWATVAGNVIGIPPPVMGLTFLAAGTSVPDLITSVLVAKQGKGDMAVSSSVGSNIFDVTVGLPLPWLLYTMVNQDAVSVSSSGIGCQIGMLFLMLVLVFFSILGFNWKMTKGMGVVMGFFYFIFVIVSLGFNYCWYTCPLG